jgi:hypothetical protein
MRNAICLLVVGAMLASVLPAAAFDIDLEVDHQYAKDVTVEKPTAGRSYGDHVVSYLRFIPKQGTDRVFPAFINTHTYLTCPNSEKHLIVNDVKQVDHDRRSGVKILGFFFDKPECDNPTVHVQPIVGNG